MRGEHQPPTPARRSSQPRFKSGEDELVSTTSRSVREPSSFVGSAKKGRSKSTAAAAAAAAAKRDPEGDSLKQEYSKQRASKFMFSIYDDVDDDNTSKGRTMAASRRDNSVQSKSSGIMSGTADDSRDNPSERRDPSERKSGSRRKSITSSGYYDRARRTPKEPVEEGRDVDDADYYDTYSSNNVTNKIQSIRAQRKIGTKLFKKDDHSSFSSGILDTGSGDDDGSSYKLKPNSSALSLGRRFTSRTPTGIDPVQEEGSDASSSSNSASAKSKGIDPVQEEVSATTKSNKSSFLFSSSMQQKLARLRGESDEEMSTSFSTTKKDLQVLDDASQQQRSAKSSASSAASIATAATSGKMQIQPMRWTEQETDNLLIQLEFFGDTDKEFQRFSKQGGNTQKLVDCIHAIVEKDQLRRDDPMLHTLSKSLHSIQLVDLDKLLELLQEQHKAGDMMEDKRVLLLCGPAGSGKTTTLHFLAGTTLEEVEEQGFLHLKPVQFQNKQLKDYETSCCKKRITRNMQATSVVLEDSQSKTDQEVIVCDTPGLGPFESVEEEISNGLGMISEIQRAKSVHPLLILSKETLGSRFGNMKNIIHSMRDQFVLESKADLEPLNYVFSKYEGKHRGRICKQISVLESVPPEVPEEDRVMFKAIVKDIMKKTTPKANLVLPMEDNHVRYLQELWETVEARDGKDLLVPFASETATQQFKIQLQLTVYDFANLLAKGDYKLALHRLNQLEELAQILPDARESAKSARQAGVRHITLVSELAREMIEAKDFASAIFRVNEIGQLDKEIPGARSSRERAMKKLRKGLKQMVDEEPMDITLGRLANLVKLRRQQPQTKEFVQQGFDAILKVILRSMEDQDFDKTLSHLEALSEVAHKLPEAGECAWHALKEMKELVRGLSAGSEFGNLLQFMLQLSKIASVFPDATECIQIGFESLKEKSMSLFEAKNYSRFIAQIRQLSELTPFLPYDHISVNRGNLLLMDTIGEVIDKQDFNTAVDVIQNIQNLDAVLSDATECIEGGFESLLRRAVSAIDDVHYGQAAGMMEKLSKLLPALPTGTESIKRGLKLLASNVQRVVGDLELTEAVVLLGQLHEVAKALPEVQDGVESGFELLLQRSTTMLGKESYREGLDQLLHLGKLARKLSISSEAVQRGVAELHQTVQNTVDDVELESGVELVHRLNKFRDVHPEFGKCVNGGFEKLIQKAGKPMSANDCSLAVSQLEALGNIKHKFVLTDDSVERGLKEVSITLRKFLQFMEFQKAVDVLQKFFKLTQVFPETIQCVRLGFEVLLEKSVDLFDHKEYSQSLSELKQLGQIFQQFSLPDVATRGNIKCLSTLIPNAMTEVEFDDAANILRELTDVVRSMPETVECVILAVEALLDHSVLAISVDNHSQAFMQMKQLAAAIEAVPDSADSARRGLQRLGSTVSDTMQQLEFDKAIELIRELNELSSLYPKVREVVQTGFGRLLERTAEAFEKEGFSQGISHLQKLGQLRQLLEMDESAVSDSRRRVLQHLVGTVQRNVDILAFSTALKFVQDLNDIAKTYPEAKEGVQAGFESLLRRAVKSLEEKKSSAGADMLVQVGELQARLDIDQSALNGLGNIVLTVQRIFVASDLTETTELMKKLGKLVDWHPEALECVDRGLQLLWDNFEQSIDESKYDIAADLLKEIGAYQMVSSVADRYLRKGMKRMKKIASDSSGGESSIDVKKLIQNVVDELAQKDGTYQNGSENLRKEMETKIQERDYRAAATLMRTLLTEMAEFVPEATEYVRDGFRLVVQSIDTSLASQDSASIVSVLQHFSKLNDLLPEASLCLEYGASILKSLVEKSVAKKDFGDTAILLEHLHASSGELERLRGVVQHGVSVMGKAIEKPVRPEQHDEMVHVIQQFSQSSIPKAGDCARRGLKGLWISVKRSLEEQNYAAAISLMRQMKELSLDLPEAGDCVQLAFVALRVRLIKTIDKQNYEMATDLMQQLSALSEELPEAFECAQFGFEALQERLGKTVDEKKYSMIIQQMNYLGKVEEHFPEVADLFKVGFSTIAEAVSNQIGRSDFSKAVDLMEQLTDLAKERIDAMDCTRKGLFSFWSAFEDRIERKEYGQAVEVLQHLGKLAMALSEAEDGVQLGFEVLEEKFEKMIEMKNYDSAVALMQDLSKLAYELPEASSCIQNGFEVLRERLVKIIEQQDYSTARNLIGKLEQQLPTSALSPCSPGKVQQPNKESDDSLCSESLEITIDGEDKVDVLRERLVSTVNDKDFGAAVDVMMTLSNMEHLVLTAGETLELGYTTIKDQLKTLVDQMDCKTAQEMILTLHRQTHRLPLVGECARFGLEELRKSVEQRVEEKEYELAIELIEVLCKLSRELVDAVGFAQGALNGAIQHMVILREETATSFEELGYVEDNKLFAQMLETTCENLEAVIATEELRMYCDHLDKMELGTEEDPRMLECTLRLATSETFCKEQIRRVAEAVNSDFPDLMVGSAYIELFAGSEDTLLSVLERLSLLKRVLQHCPGAASVISAQSEGFERFYSFVDGVISLAQSEFLPRMNLRAFETQAILVTSLIDGFLETKGSISRDERRKMEDLEHRQARLMLRFEIEVADAMEVMSKHSFPHFDQDDPRDKVSSYIRSMRVSQLQKHREVLSACVNSRELTDMISDNVDISTADRTISFFDKSLDKFLDHLISQLEEEKETIDSSEKRKGGAPPPEAKEQVEALCKDVTKVTEEVTHISSWPTEVYSVDASYYLSRLRTLENSLLTKKILENDGMGFGSFLATLTTKYVPNVTTALTSFNGITVSDYYSCTVKTTSSGEE